MEYPTEAMAPMRYNLRGPGCWCILISFSLMHRNSPADRDADTDNGNLRYRSQSAITRQDSKQSARRSQLGVVPSLRNSL